MKAVIAVASALACALSLDAQIAATLNHLPDGVDEVRIRNNSAIGLVAFVVTVRHVSQSPYSNNAPFVMYSDPLIKPATKQLLAGEERVAMVNGFRDRSGRHLGLLEPAIAAGILADGTPVGDATLLSRLILRRSNMLLAVETTLEMLSDAGRRNVPRDQLIERFGKMADSVSHWYLPPEQQVGRSLYQSIAGKLMNLPEEQAGAPFPPAAFVAQETALLRRQRVKLLESEPSLSDATLIER
ncbi:MAG: hypothetical protein ACRD9L_03015 [Bryobacteraceae bacterium]